MLKRLQLKNFRKHRDLTLDFTAGLNLLRGNNENGKTTIFESIQYAMFGTSALRESLTDVVTHGEADSSLKVVLHLEFDGVDYSISRGKSGAEIVYADQRVTGQTETRRFIENLFQCSTDLAGKLMFAGQNSIRGVLSSGDTAANALVESLADLNIIEKWVEKIQSDLPYGSTKVLDTQIVELESAVDILPVEPSNDQITDLTQKISGIQAKIDLSERARIDDQELAKAQATLADYSAAKARIAIVKSRQAELTAILATPVTVPNFSEQDLERTRTEAANEAEAARRLKAYSVKFPKAAAVWEGTKDTAQAELDKSKAVVAQSEAKVKELERSILTAQMKAINEKSCAFCKKDLTDVPEVAAINAEAAATIAASKAELKIVQAQFAEAKATVAAISQILEVTGKCETLAGEYWNLDYSQLPPLPVWKGEPPVVGDAAARLKSMETVWKSYQAELVQRSMREAELAGLVFPALPPTEIAEALVKQSEQVEAELQTLRLELAQVQGLLGLAQAQYREALEAVKRAEAEAVSRKLRLQELKTTRESMLVHNELIRKLRAARPQVAAQMWNSVLGAISHYFTKVRGENSVVTRTADGFLVNGKGIKGLSGSTLDALGLAIRMALSQLFLPSVPFLFVDEGFAGCDEDRELAGVATLASAGFSQIVLITHSSAPEASADNLIVL